MSSLSSSLLACQEEKVTLQSAHAPSLTKLITDLKWEESRHGYQCGGSFFSEPLVWLRWIPKEGKIQRLHSLWVYQLFLGRYLTPKVWPDSSKKSHCRGLEILQISEVRFLPFLMGFDPMSHAAATQTPMSTQKYPTKVTDISSVFANSRNPWKICGK